jgi:hypothetical protein
VDHSEGKDEERVVAIPRFQGGTPRSMSVKNRVILAPMASFDLYRLYVRFYGAR